MSSTFFGRRRFLEQSHPSAARIKKAHTLKTEMAAVDNVGASDPLPNSADVDEGALVR